MSGLQIRKCLGGKWEAKDDYDSDSGTIDADVFNIDYGALVGADVMFGPKFGIRGTNYSGLSDMINDVPSNSNYKNRGFVINLLIKV